MSFFVTLLTLTLTPAQIFDAAVAANSHQMRGDVSILAETKLKSVHTVSQIRLQFIEPDRLSMTIREPQQTNRAASDRTYSLGGNQFVAVDNLEGDYTERDYPFPSSLDLAGRIITTLGSAGDAVGALLSPPEMSKFFASFRQLPDLKLTASGSLVILKRSRAGAKVEFDFGAQDHLLRKVRLDNPQGFLLWTFSYGSSPLSIALPRTVGLRKVESLTVKAIPPKFKSKAAHDWAARSERAYAKLTNSECQFSGPEGTGTFAFSDHAYRQEAAGNTWGYADRQLWAWWSPVLYKSGASITKVPSLLSRLHTTVQPMLLQIMEGRNPMGTLLVTESTVRLAGELSIEGQPCVILEIRSKGLAVDVTLRKSDALIVSTRVAVQGRRGEVALREENTYRYMSVNRPLEASTFQAPSGSARPFPK